VAVTSLKNEALSLPWKSVAVTSLVLLHLKTGGTVSSRMLTVVILQLLQQLHLVVINTLWTGDADLRLYITTVQDG